MNRATIFEIIRFGAVGASVAALQLVLVFMLTDMFGMWYLIASVLSYSIAIVVNFTLQKFFVHKHMEKDAIKSQFVKYVLLGFFCLALNTVGMYTLVTYLGVPYLYAQALIVGMLAIFTFVMHRFVIFV
jgi:putative flippase GtrA